MTSMNKLAQAARGDQVVQSDRVQKLGGSLKDGELVGSCNGTVSRNVRWVPRPHSYAQPQLS